MEKEDKLFCFIAGVGTFDVRMMLFLIHTVTSSA